MIWGLLRQLWGAVSATYTPIRGTWAGGALTRGTWQGGAFTRATWSGT